MDKLLVTLFGLAGIAFTYWFFLGKKEDIVVYPERSRGKAKDSLDITVSGGYSPSVISVPKGKTTKLNFIRKDPSSCLEEVILSDFKIRKFLPLNKKVTIEVKPQKEGTYNFECGMNMFHGKIIVR